MAILFILWSEGPLSLTPNSLKQGSHSEYGEGVWVMHRIRCRAQMSGGSDSKASAYNVGDLDSIPGLGRSPGEGNGNPLQYPCLENSMDGGAW